MTEKDEITGLWHYDIRLVSAKESDIIEVGEYEVTTWDFRINLLLTGAEIRLHFQEKHLSNGFKLRNGFPPNARGNDKLLYSRDGGSPFLVFKQNVILFPLRVINVHAEYEPDKDCFLGRVENNKGEAEFGEDRFHLLRKATGWGIEKAKSIVEEEYDLLGFVGLPDENKRVLNEDEKYGGQGAWLYQDYPVKAKYSPEFDVGKLEIPLWTLNTKLFVITAEYDPVNKWYVGCVFDKSENVSFGSKDGLTSAVEAARWCLKTALSVLKTDKELLEAAGLPSKPKRLKN